MKYLVFQHVPHEPLGLISDVLKKQGIEVQIIEFWKKGWKIPDISQFDALIIMGGPMGVYEGSDVFPSKEEELKIIRDNLGKKPMIGFCLGSQLLAHAFGGKVYPNFKNGHRAKEIGYYTVDLTPEGKKDLLLAGLPDPLEVMQWHGDAFEIPEGGIKLASSFLCDNQAFRIGTKTYGFLFHFEFTPDMVKQQIEIDKKWIHEDFDMDEEKLLRQAQEKKDLMRIQCERLFENFNKLTQIP